MSGWESGLQGGSSGAGGSVFVGWKVENWQVIDTYTGFSFGASLGVTPADATLYTGYSASIYENYEKVKK